MEDIFSMFGMRGGQGGQKQKARVKPIARQVEVSLADVYNGKTIEVEVDRQRICDKCNGIGGTDASAVQTCSSCKGRGMKTTMRMMGPGMYSQSTGPCDDCNGQGEMINMEKRCKVCKGKKVKRDKKKLTVEMDKGSPNGEQFTIHGAIDKVFTGQRSRNADHLFSCLAKNGVFIAEHFDFLGCQPFRRLKATPFR